MANSGNVAEEVILKYIHPVAGLRKVKKTIILTLVHFRRLQPLPPALAGGGLVAIQRSYIEWTAGL